MNIIRSMPVASQLRLIGRLALTVIVLGLAWISAAAAQQSFKTPDEAVEALVAAAASTSPIRMLIESVRDETVLTRERKDAKSGGNGAGKEAAAAPLLAPEGVSPGASIEGLFRQLHQAVEGDGKTRMSGPNSAMITSAACSPTPGTPRSRWAA